MQVIHRLMIGILLVLFFMVDRFLPSSPLAGSITHLSSVIETPLPHQEATVQLANRTVSALLYTTTTSYTVGNRVLLQADPIQTDLYTITDKVRTGSLTRLFILFLLVIFGVTGLAGIRSLLGLVFSFAIIFQFVLPQIIAGSNPLMVALVASLMILIISYFLTHGVNEKSVIAILGTFGALVVTGILALIFGADAHLSGFGSEEASFLVGQLPIEQFYNLLLAGIIIGSLGVLDDITISQASIVGELRDSNHKFGTGELYRRAMRIGRDHIASLVNTLVLVYAGSALPLLLLFVLSHATPLALLNYEAVAEEVVRTLVGSIGLVTAVPLTTLIAAIWYGSKR